MVKKLKFTESTTHATNYIEENTNLFGVCKYDSKYWTLYSATAESSSIASVPVASLTGAGTLEHTYGGVGSGHDIVDKNKVISTGHTDWIYGCYINDNGANYDLRCSYTEDGGANWADVTMVSAQANIPYIIDIVYGELLTVEHATIIYLDGTSIKSMSWAAGVQIGATQTFSLTMVAPEAIWRGFHWYDRDEYFFDISTAVGVVYQCGIDPNNLSEYTFLDDSGILIPTSWDIENQVMSPKGTSFFVIDMTNFQYVPNRSTIFQHYTSGPAADVAIIFEDDPDGVYNKVIKYACWNDYIWRVLDNGVVGSIQDWDFTAYGGWDDFITTGSGIYEPAPQPWTDITIAKVTTSIYTAPSILLRSLTEPLENQYLFVYTNADQLVWEGFVSTYEFDTQSYKYNCLSGVSSDFKQKVDISFEGKTAAEIIKEVIDEYGVFLHYTTNISGVPATIYTISFNKTLLDVFKWADNREGYVTTVRPNGEVYWDQFSASGIAITDVGQGNVDYISTLKYTSSKLSRIILWGGFVDGVQLRVERFGEPNYGTWEDWYPEITNQSDLDDLIDQLLLDKNVLLGKAKVGIFGEGMLYYGTSSSLTLTPWSIAADIWYHNSITYDLLTDVNDSVLTDAYYSHTKNTTDKAVQNEQNIATIESNVNNPGGKGIDPSRVEVDSDDEYGKGIWLGVVDWGTTGASITDLATWSNSSIAPSTDEIQASFDGHNYPLKLDSNSAAYKGVKHDYTSSESAVEFHIQFENTTGRCLCSFYDGSNWRGIYINAGNLYASDNAGDVDTGINIVADTWYHFRIAYKKNDYFRMFMNGTLIYSGTSQNTDITYFYMMPYDMYIHVDGLGFEDDGYLPWSNFGAGHLSCKSIERDGDLLGLTYHQLDKNQDYCVAGHTNVNATYIIMDFYLGSQANNVSSITDNMTLYRIPSSAKMVTLSLKVSSTIGNTTDYVIIHKNGNSSIRTGVKQHTDATTNCHTCTQGNIVLDVNGKAYVRFRRSAGNLYYEITLEGYWT